MARLKVSKRCFFGFGFAFPPNGLRLIYTQDGCTPIHCTFREMWSALLTAVYLWHWKDMVPFANYCHRDRERASHKRVSFSNVKANQRNHLGLDCDLAWF